jgi:Response regulator receiver domain
MLLDYDLPERDGVSAVSAIIEASPGVRVLMLTSYTDPVVLSEAMEAGCSGFITKRNGASEILAAVLAVASDETPASPDMGGLKDPKRAANRVAKYNLSGWIGIQDTPEELTTRRTAIQRELDEVDGGHSIDDLEIASMCWFVITDEKSDQTPKGKGSNILIGTAEQITDNLKRLKEAGLTMPLFWPPFQDVPVSKTLDDMKRLKEEIMPKVDAM